MVQIIPSILEISEDNYQQTLSRLSACQGLEGSWVHIDFADNNFVPNQTVGPEVISYYPTDFKKEAHLMVSHPKQWIDKLVEAGFERIIFHFESEDNPDQVIDDIKSKGKEVGIAINHETPIEKLTPYIDKIEVVLVMTIVPGFQGQPFIPEALDKVRDIKSRNWNVRVGVDGHIVDENLKEVIASGVNFIIVGSYLLKGDIDENLERIWEITQA